MKLVAVARSMLFPNAFYSLPARALPPLPPAFSQSRVLTRVVRRAKPRPRRPVMFEDSFKNLVTAKSLGMSTVFIHSDTAREEGVSEEQLATVDAVVRDVRVCVCVFVCLFVCFSH